MEIDGQIPEPPPKPANDQEWRKQYQETKRRNREEKRGHGKKFIGKCCTVGCSHANDWDSRIAKSIDEEQSIFQKYAEVCLVERESVDREVNEVPVNKQRVKFDVPYETVTVTVDSGAYNTVGPPSVGTHFKITDTEASKTGRNYRAANGTVIRNYGQRIVRGTNEVGLPLSLPIQVADVNKVLGSVREMVRAGNKVVFDQDSSGKCCSYLEHKSTGKRTAIHENNGNFEFIIKVPKGEGSVDKVENVRAIIKNEAGTDSEGFPRQGTLMADLFY